MTVLFVWVAGLFFNPAKKLATEITEHTENSAAPFDYRALAVVAVRSVAGVLVCITKHRCCCGFGCLPDDVSVQDQYRYAG